MANKNGYKFILLAIMSLSLAAVLAGEVSGYYALEYYLKAPRRGNYLFRGLEGIKGVLGDYFWIKADDYYHGGVSDVARECRGLHRHADIEDECAKEARKEHGRLDFIQKINAAIMVDEHIHLSGEEAKEMLPWFRLATLLNPRNVDAYVDGAFWLARKFQRPQEAIGFLKEGMENNPDDYRIYSELGFLYYYEGDPDRATQSLDKSVSLWKDANDPNAIERSTVYDFLGYLYQKKGDYAKAADNYNKFLRIFPDNQKIRDKLKEIEQK